MSVTVENNTKLHLCLFGHGTKTNYVKPCIPQTQPKLPKICLSSSEMVSLCSVAASDFPYALLFDIASSKRLLTFNSLSELVLQAANASFLCIAVRADVLLEVEKYLPSSSSDSAVKLSQNFCRKSTNGNEVAYAFLQQKRLQHSTKSVRRNCCVYYLKAAFPRSL